MQIYDFTVAANTQRQLDAPGTYFYYYSGSAGGADQTITLRGVSSGLRIVLKNGQSLRLPAGQAPETSWYIGNYANAATIVGTVIVGNGEIQDNRIQGSVEVVDGGKYRSLGGNAFCGAARINAVAAQNAVASIWNPPGSGKNVLIETIGISSTTANFLYWGTHTATTAVLVGNLSNKKAGGTVSASQAYNGNVVGTPTGFGYQGFLAVVANQPMQWQFKEPIAIPPGFGFCVQNNTVNADLQVTFEFYEEGTA